MSKKDYCRGINQINSSQLIKKVSQIPALWQKSHKHYKNRNIQLQYWLQITHELNASVEDVKIRWRSIRERHRKEKMRQQREPNTEPRYHYFEECAFLNVNYQKPNDSSENNDSLQTLTDESLNNLTNDSDDEDFRKASYDNETLTSKIENGNDDLDDEADEEHLSGDEDEEKLNCNSNKRSSRKPQFGKSRSPEDDDDKEIARLLKLIESESNQEKKPQNTIAANDPIAIRQAKNNNLRVRPTKSINSKSELKHQCHENDQSNGNIPKPQDADKAFFVSLLPHLRKLNSAQKLRCRMDIQRIIYKYAYEDD